MQAIYREGPLFPKLLKPRRVGCRISDGVLNIPVPKIILDQPRVRSLVRQSEPACVPKHMGMSGQGKVCHLPIAPDRHPCRLAAQRPAPLTHKEGVRVGLHLRPIREPRLNGPQLVRAEWVRRGQAFLEPRHVQDAAFGVHLGKDQAASLRHAQPMPEHEEQEAPVAGLVPGPLGGGKELLDFVAGEVFSFLHHFV